MHSHTFTLTPFLQLSWSHKSCMMVCCRTFGTALPLLPRENWMKCCICCWILSPIMSLMKGFSPTRSSSHQKTHTTYSRMRTRRTPTSHSFGTQRFPSRSRSSVGFLSKLALTPRPTSSTRTWLQTAASPGVKLLGQTCYIYSSSARTQLKFGRTLDSLHPSPSTKGCPNAARARRQCLAICGALYSMENWGLSQLPALSQCTALSSCNY